MRTNAAGWLFVCLTAGVGIVLVLWLLIGPDNPRQSFSRNFIIPPLVVQGAVELDFNSYNIAGRTSNRIYLGNATAPLHALAADLWLERVEVITIAEGDSLDASFSEFTRLKIDSPYFYITDGVAPNIFRGTMSNWTLTEQLADVPYFTDIVPTEGGSFIVRSLERSNEYALGRLSPRDGQFNLRSDILEKQVDGRFCIEGTLNYDRSLSSLSYVYVYRNEFLLLDPQLNPVGRGRTIDTTSRAAVKPVYVESGGFFALSKRPAYVNKRSTTYHGLLFVHSGIMGSNDDERMFQSSAVIDVYGLADCRYHFSFYIPNFKNERLRGFEVFSDRLVALYDRHLVSYGFSMLDY